MRVHFRNPVRRALRGASGLASRALLCSLHLVLQTRSLCAQVRALTSPGARVRRNKALFQTQLTEQERLAVTR